VNAPKGEDWQWCFSGFDLSDKTTHVCGVDADGVVLRRDVAASDPDVLAKWLGRYCPDLGVTVTGLRRVTVTGYGGYGGYGDSCNNPFTSSIEG
jgi:hypothetical protein